MEPNIKTLFPLNNSTEFFRCWMAELNAALCYFKLLNILVSRGFLYKLDVSSTNPLVTSKKLGEQGENLSIFVYLPWYIRNTAWSYKNKGLYKNIYTIIKQHFVKCVPNLALICDLLEVCIKSFIVSESERTLIGLALKNRRCVWQIY